MNHHLIKSLVRQKKFRLPFIGALWTPKGTGKFEALVGLKRVVEKYI
jgi:hypothetical protein